MKKNVRPGGCSRKYTCWFEEHKTILYSLCSCNLRDCCSFSRPAPGVCGAALLQTNISNTFQLHQQKLHHVFCLLHGLEHFLLIPGLNPEHKIKITVHARRRLQVNSGGSRTFLSDTQSSREEHLLIHPPGPLLQSFPQCFNLLYFVLHGRRVQVSVLVLV